MTRNKYFHLISLGCPKNRVDAERILAGMVGSGFTYTPELLQANIVIVNTCGFIQEAVEESIDVVLSAGEQNPDAFLVIAGCLPVRYKEGLQESVPEAHLLVRPDQVDDLPNLILSARQGAKSLPAGECRPETRPTSAGKRAESRVQRIVSTPGYAYLKIAEGCRRRCRYCTIPSIRGSLKSTPIDDLVTEARGLASVGVRELVLVAQELTAYGLDRGDKNALIRLLREIRELPGIKWIRLMYLHPASISDALPRIINESDNILPYLDVPFQHVADNVLRLMRRSSRGDSIRRLVERLRKEIPGLVLRTTLMVGYPGEGQEEFAELRDFVSSYAIERVGVFTYSPEEGTSAFKLGDPVPDSVKKARAHEIRSINSKLMAKLNRERIGSVEQCLVEGVSDETEFLLQGRIWDQAPEVDGVLYITSGKAAAGEMRKVRITDSHAADLFGKLTSPHNKKAAHDLAINVEIQGCSD